VTTALVRREVHFVAILSRLFENAAGFKIRPGGTEGSNPAPSSKESAANLLRAAEIIRSGAARILRLSEFKIADAMRIYTDTHNVTEGRGRGTAGRPHPRAPALFGQTRRRNMQWQHHRRAGLCRDPRRPHAGPVI
jgi:hypothetical protein